MFKILTLNFNNITTGTGLLNHRPSLVRRQCLLFALYLQLQKVCYNNVSKGGGAFIPYSVICPHSYPLWDGAVLTGLFRKDLFNLETLMRTLSIKW